MKVESVCPRPSMVLAMMAVRKIAPIDRLSNVSKISLNTPARDSLRGGGAASRGIWACVPRDDTIMAVKITPAATHA